MNTPSDIFPADPRRRRSPKTGMIAMLVATLVGLTSVAPARAQGDTDVDSALDAMGEDTVPGAALPSGDETGIIIVNGRKVRVSGAPTGQEKGIIIVNGRKLYSSEALPGADERGIIIVNGAPAGAPSPGAEKGIIIIENREGPAAPSAANRVIMGGATKRDGAAQGTT